MKLKTAILALLGATTFSLSAQIAYQGRLTDNTGAPLPDPSYNITFSLWDTATAGTSVWSQTINNVSTVDGRFSVTLGDNSNGANSINTRIKTDHFLQVSVGGTPLLPRQQILAAPRAVVADTTNSVGQIGTKPYIMLDTANDRIGINTETPEADLQIDGTTRLYHEAGYFEDTLQISKNLNGSGSIRTLGLHGYGIDSDNLLLLNKRSNQGIETGTGGLRITGGGLGVNGDTTLDNTTIDGTTNINGTCLVTSTGSSALTLVTPDSAATFRRPFLISSSAGTRLLGFQLGSNGGGEATGLVLEIGTAFKPGGGSWAAASDARLKKNVNNLAGSLDRLEQLRPVTFEFNNEERHGVSGLQTGFIAQEVEQVFPEWIRTRDNSSPTKEGESPEPENIKTISISGFEALTVDAFRELRAEKNTEIANLKDANQALENRVKALEQKLTTIVSALDRQSVEQGKTISLK